MEKEIFLLKEQLKQKDQILRINFESIEYNNARKPKGQSKEPVSVRVGSKHSLAKPNDSVVLDSERGNVVRKSDKKITEKYIDVFGQGMLADFYIHWY